MAFLSSQGAYYRPHYNNPTKKMITPVMVDVLQTSASKQTTGAFVFETATSADDFHLISLLVSIVAPTAGAVTSVYLGKTQIAIFPTCAADVTYFYSMNFGDIGLQGGTTTTATVSIVSTATVTAYFTGLGYRHI